MTEISPQRRRERKGFKRFPLCALCAFAVKIPPQITGVSNPNSFSAATILSALAG